jgi:hypothetical protein
MAIRRGVFLPTDRRVAVVFGNRIVTLLAMSSWAKRIENLKTGTIQRRVAEGPEGVYATMPPKGVLTRPVLRELPESAIKTEESS